ncbi:MAG: serine/threonine-protein kinase [Myxococcota bacterium]|nr:serine/threonine-protein kinase [Myxococcota bacterium]
MRDDGKNRKPDNVETDPAVETTNSGSHPRNTTSGGQPDMSISGSMGATHSKPRSHTVNQRQPSSHLPSAQAIYINDRYRVEREIARGGMGRVYLATQLPLGRPVAIKVLRSEFTDGDPKFPKRFFLEASVSSQLVHPNIITIHDYGETDSGDLFMAMEFLDGVSLSYYVKKYAPLEGELIAHIAIQIARAVRVAHKSNVIHRDLKPGNVMVVPRGEDDHYIKVLDFGLVKMLEKPKLDVDSLPPPEEIDPDDDEHPVNLTKAGVLLGSPRYMAPEQIRGEELDGRTDIYALGVILYQMLAGQSPFMGKTSIDVIYQHIHHSVPPISGVEHDRDLEAIARKCLMKNRDQRYSSMSEVINELKEVQRKYGATTERTLSSTFGTNDLPEVTPSSEINSSTGSVSGKVSASHNQAEAAFQDSNFAPEPTPTNSMQFSVKENKKSRSSLYVGLAGLLIALSLIIAFTSKEEGASVTTISHPAPAKPKTVVTPETDKKLVQSKVTFDSKPQGAEIYLDDVLLGITPFATKLPSSEDVRSVTFRRKGFRELTQSLVIGKDENNLSVILEQITQPTPRIPKRRKPTIKRRAKDLSKDKKDVLEPKKSKAKPKKAPEDYRNNPY